MSSWECHTRMKCGRYITMENLLRRGVFKHSILHDGYPGPAPENVLMYESLYDLRRDPGWQYDVKTFYPEIVNELKDLAEQVRKDLGDDIQNRIGAENRPAGKVTPSK